MKKEDIDRLAESRNCIPGIYNYCDRWCERCPLTLRCLNYLMVDEHFGSDAGQHDLTNEIFWKKLSEMFTLTMEMIRETAVEMGVDLDTITEGPETEFPGPGTEAAIVHVIEHLAKRYAGLVEDWFDKECREHEGQTANQLWPLRDHKDQQNDVSAADSVEVIRWYQHQIYIKIRRALSNAAQEAEAANDADGSAKVALIGIDRSISAWGVLLKLLPDSSTEILALVNNLENLRNRVDAEFPAARNFIRPGFDKES